MVQKELKKGTMYWVLNDDWEILFVKENIK